MEGFVCKNLITKGSSLTHLNNLIRYCFGEWRDSSKQIKSAIISITEEGSVVAQFKRGLGYIQHEKDSGHEESTRCLDTRGGRWPEDNEDTLNSPVTLKYTCSSSKTMDDTVLIIWQM